MQDGTELTAAASERRNLALRAHKQTTGANTEGPSKARRGDAEDPPANPVAAAFPELSFQSELLAWVPARWRAVGRLRVTGTEHELACRLDRSRRHVSG
jgi:hypothetical protein